jgi:hypothetical protein
LPEGYLYNDKVFAFFAFTGRNLKIQNSNMPREFIRHFFPKWKCFFFDQPTKEKDLLVHIEKLPEDQLDFNFQVQSKNFCSYIFTNAKTKTLREGILVTGNRELPLPQGISLFHSVW